MKQNANNKVLKSVNISKPAFYSDVFLLLFVPNVMISFPSFLFTQLLYLSSSQYVIKIWVKTEKKTLFNKKHHFQILNYLL